MSTTTTPPEQPQQPQPEPLADLILHITKNQHKLEPTEYVSEELSRRFQVINGLQLKKYLIDCNFDRISKQSGHEELKHFIDLPPSEYEDVITTLCRRNYLRRVIPLTVNKKRYNTNNGTLFVNFAEKSAQTYDPDGLYAILIQVESPYALLKSILVVLGLFLICCYKVWPIILRIMLWWLLLFTCIFLIASIIIHYISKLLFTIMCLRGYSFMPNLMDEEISFFETFSPVLGTGGEHQRRWAIERQRQIKAREKLLQNDNNNIKQQPHLDFTPTTNESTDTTTLTQRTNNKTIDNEQSTTTKSKTDPKSKSPTPPTVDDDDDDIRTEFNILHTWQAGMFFFFILFIAGGIGCYHMGLFDPEMVPDFLVNNNEMRYYFPAIAATSSNNDNDEYDDNRYQTGEEVSLE